MFGIKTRELQAELDREKNRLHRLIVAVAKEIRPGDAVMFRNSENREKYEKLNENNVSAAAEVGVVESIDRRDTGFMCADVLRIRMECGDVRTVWRYNRDVLREYGVV